MEEYQKGTRVPKSWERVGLGVADGNKRAHGFALWPSCEDFPTGHQSQYYFHMSKLNCQFLGTPLAGVTITPLRDSSSSMRLTALLRGPHVKTSRPQPMWDLPRVSHKKKQRRKPIKKFLSKKEEEVVKKAAEEAATKKITNEEAKAAKA
ncbi:hypothetical protein Tco_0073048 [Tanacetum coccineum]